MKTRKGFTLIELLVVISIIGMLAGMLMPAINAAREAGRRTTCINNQKQLVTALSVYQSARNNFPPFRFAQPTDDVYETLGDNLSNVVGDTTTVNWIQAIFPYIEQVQLWEDIIGGPVPLTGDSAHVTANNHGLRFPFLHCQSNGSLQEGGNAYVANCGFNDGVEFTMAGTFHEYYLRGGAYVGSFSDRFGTAVKNSGIGLDTNKANGVFFDGLHTGNRGLNVDDFLDGLSSTVLISENSALELTHPSAFSSPYDGMNVLPKDRTKGIGAMWATQEYEVGFCWPLDVSYSASLKDTDGYYSTQLKVVPTNSGFEFYSIPNCSEFVATDYSLVTNEKKPCKIGQCFRDVTVSQWVTARPSSNHGGVIVMGFADSSVRAIRTDIDPIVYARLLCSTDNRSTLDFPAGTLNLGDL